MCGQQEREMEKFAANALHLPSFKIANNALPRMKLPSQSKRGKMGGYLFILSLFKKKVKQEFLLGRSGNESD